jgi:shikimate dehydrogenase
MQNSPISRPSIQPTIQNSAPEMKDTRENKFALIGYPLGHSLSKVIHEAGFKSLGINATYDILETPPDTLVDRIKWLKTNGYKGFNVTIPLKLPISLFVNEVDKYADLARAVNTVYIDADKSLKAYNTDVIGFKRAIPSDINLRGQKVAILGTGGAGHASCVALSECGVKEIAFFTRNIPNSIELMNYVRRKFPNIEFNVYQIENIRSLEEYSMLVNTTPIGMLGRAGDMTPVEIPTLKTLRSDAVVYDVIYNPKKTILIKDAQKLGLRTITGLDMLIYQAVSAQEIWFGNTPDWKDMKISALEVL